MAYAVVMAGGKWEAACGPGSGIKAPKPLMVLDGKTL